MVPLLIVPNGRRGSTLYSQGGCTNIDSVEAKQVDPTGAGDVFASSFIAKYRDILDYENAARFASLVAGMSVEGYGASMVPSYGQLCS